MATNRGKRTMENRCSIASKKYGEIPGGTASRLNCLLLIELPKPWPAEIHEAPNFPEGVFELLEHMSGQGMFVKTILMEPDKEYSVSGLRRVIFFSQPADNFAAYNKSEFILPPEEISPLAKSLLSEPETLKRFEAYRQETDHVRDILVCTHGIYDACCGSFGYPIYDKLRKKYMGYTKDNVRAWQVSHLGGHRFAPNVLDMPEGRNWVRVDADALMSIVERSKEPSELSRFHRGWAGVSGPYEQLVEQEAFFKHGWDWTRILKSSKVLSSDNGSYRIHLNFLDPTTKISGLYEATVQRVGTVAKANCINMEDDEIEQFAVTDLKKTK